MMKRTVKLLRQLYQAETGQVRSGPQDNLSKWQLREIANCQQSPIFQISIVSKLALCTASTAAIFLQSERLSFSFLLDHNSEILALAESARTMEVSAQSTESANQISRLQSVMCPLCSSRASRNLLGLGPFLTIFLQFTHKISQTRDNFARV